MKIWFIEDDPICNLISASLLRKSRLDAEVRYFLTAEEALEALNGASDWPDLILLDLNLPGIDGWTFLERYQGLRAPGSLTPVMILTSSIMARDLERAASHPFAQGYLTKPFNQVALNTLEQISESKAA